MNTPKNVIDNFVNVGIAKAQLRGGKLMLLSMMAGAYIAIGGVLSVVAGFGFPELTAGNPSLQRLLSGAAFPIGLILVVILGAELFTGNNAVLMPAALQGKISPWAAVRNWVAVYLGNFMGALLFTMLFVYAVGLTAAEPYQRCATHRRSESVDAVARRAAQRHRSQLVCLPCRVARRLCKDDAGQNGWLLAARDGVCGTWLRTLHRQYVFHSDRNA